MCCISIDYTRFLLLSDKGLKLIELMESAVRCTREFDEERNRIFYSVGDEMEIEYLSVRPGQLDFKRSSTGQ